MYGSVCVHAELPADFRPRMIPTASPTLTPVQYGAVVPDGTVWPVNYDETMYNVADVYPTVQGEGRLAGTPMTIVRLQGCPVSCVFCDQPESWDPKTGTWMDVAALVLRVAALTPRWTLVTGGEPTWHYLWALTHGLQRQGLRTALETSGTFPVTGAWNWICWSPKPFGKIPALASAYFRCANEVKWLVGRDRDVTMLEEFLAQTAARARRSDQAITIQPISCSPKATRICLDALMKHPDWFLSAQLHKYIGVR